MPCQETDGVFGWKVLYIFYPFVKLAWKMINISQFFHRLVLPVTNQKHKYTNNMNKEKVIQTALQIKAGSIQLDLSDLNKLVADIVLLNTDKKLIDNAVNEVANAKYDIELNRLANEKNRLIDSLQGKKVVKSPLDL